MIITETYVPSYNPASTVFSCEYKFHKAIKNAADMHLTWQQLSLETKKKDKHTPVLKEGFGSTILASRCLTKTGKTVNRCRRACF